MPIGSVRIQQRWRNDPARAGQQRARSQTEYRRTYEESKRSCDWFAEAAAYSAVDECPFVLDDSHMAWTRPAWIESEGLHKLRFAFNPYRLGRYVFVCLYEYAESESD
jgi:hypothetical protein